MGSPSHAALFTSDSIKDLLKNVRYMGRVPLRDGHCEHISQRNAARWEDPAFKARMGRQIALGWENRNDISNPTTEEVPSLQAHRPRLAAAP